MSFRIDRLEAEGFVRRTPDEGDARSVIVRAWLAAGHDVRFGVPDPSDSRYAELPQERLQPASERRGAELSCLRRRFAR